MKFPQECSRVRPVRRLRNLHFRSAKFAPFAIISLFFFFNFTGLAFSPGMAPDVDAATRGETIPEDIRAGERAGVDPRFIHAVIKQESKYDPKAVSHVGAQGLMQMMPATAKRFGLKDPFDATANVAAGTKYLKWLLNRFDGDVSLALAGYNAGEGAVDKYQGVPPYSETQNYVKKIVSNYGKTYHPILPPDDAKLAFHLVSYESQTSSDGL